MPKIRPVASKPVYGLVLRIVMMSAVGCFFNNKNVGTYNCSELFRTYFKKPHNFQMEEFSKYDIEKQYAIFICGTQVSHPPDLSLALAFAEEGRKTVGFLKTKLQEAKDDMTIEGIVSIFAYMTIKKTYDVVRDHELMGLIIERVKGIQSPFWREMSERHLVDIKYYSDSVKTFLKKPVKVQMQEFGNYDLETQYAIFIYGTQVAHPHAFHLPEAFAQQGSKVVGFLKVKLLEEDYDPIIGEIIHVFTEMKRLKTYDVAGDRELIRLIIDRMKGMKDSFWRLKTEKSLRDSGLLSN